MKNFLNQIKLTGVVMVLIFYLTLLIAIVVVFVNLFSPSDANIGLIGAIVGGIISGSLTVLGVYLTIQVDKNKAFIESYPIKKSNSELIKSELDRLHNKIMDNKPYNDFDHQENVFNIIDSFNHNYDKEILNKSISCGGEIFSCVMSFKGEMNEFLQLIKDNITVTYNDNGFPVSNFTIRAEDISRFEGRLFKYITYINREIARLDKRMEANMK